MDHLLTEARNPASTNLDELTPLELVRLMAAEDAQVPAAVLAQAEAIARAIEGIAERLRQGGRLIYAGAGTSGRLGVLDATECPPTFNSPPGQVIGIIAGGPRALTQAVEGAEDHPEFAEHDLAALNLTAGDALVGIATSGRTPYVLGAIAYARRVGALTVGLSCNPDSELSGQTAIAITVPVGPEVLSGSTRLKAGTATKLVLNMLSTGAMVRLGKTYGNLMVDLRATNEKLRARTNRIVRQLTGLSRAEAAALLEQCGGELKTALVAALGRATPEEARRLLAAAGGQVRPALGSLGATAAAAPAYGDLLLGIDGGGTHTVALLARMTPGALKTSGVCLPAEANGAWTIVGRGAAGPSNLQAVGASAALRALDQAVGGAFASAGLVRGPVTAACLGLAGADRAADRALVLDWAGRVGLARQTDVTNDAALLLAAGTPDGWGLAVISGTGSIAYAKTSDGCSARAGGWGYLLGDEGSGYAIAVAGLQAVARAADDRGAATLLSERLLGQLGLREPAQLIATIYGKLTRPEIAGLAPVVLETAAAGDAVAATLVVENAAALAAMAAAATRSLFAPGTRAALALAGGVFTGQPMFRERFLDALRGHGIMVDPIGIVHEPAHGAVRLACAAFMHAPFSPGS